MKISQQHSAAFDLNSTIFTAPYSNVPSPYITEIYPMQHLEVSSETSMHKMYSIDHTMHGENLINMKNSKKENIFQTMFNTFTNMVAGHLPKIPFMSHMNNPLSVTIVQNQGIISHEFFRSLTQREEPVTTDNIYIHDNQIKESLNIIKQVNNITHDEKKPNIIENFDEMLSYYENRNKHDDDESKNGMKNMLSSNCWSQNVLPTYDYVDSMEADVEKDNDIAEFIFPSEEEINEINENIYLEEPEKHFAMAEVNEVKNTMEKNSTDRRNDNENIKASSNPCQSQISLNVLTNIWQKVFSGVTHRFDLETDFDSESKMPMRKLHLSKQRKKLNTVAKGRGRGRARSQLRRSGVSQTRCRKECTKHDLEVDIQNDFEIWQEFELYHTVQTNSPIDRLDIDEKSDMSDMVDFIIKDRARSTIFTFADIKSKKQKPKMCKIVDQGMSKQTKVRYVSEYIDINAFNSDYNNKKCNSQMDDFRPRLMSESSADSEDSYCIVFETEPETNCKIGFKYDEISSDDEDEDDDDDDDNGNDNDNYDDDDDEYENKVENEVKFQAPVQKVKFNLQPVVHVMIKWDYAYRAARKGPWEEMARDRDRFKSRINCTEHILKPILSNQHRSHIWHERFASME